MCAKYPYKFHLHWCVDGHKETTHIQSKHKMAVLERNMNAFSEAVGEYAYRAKWVYIVFDLNEHELEIAQRTR